MNKLKHEATHVPACIPITLFLFIIKAIRRVRVTKACFNLSTISQITQGEIEGVDGKYKLTLSLGKLAIQAAVEVVGLR